MPQLSPILWLVFVGVSLLFLVSLMCSVGWGTGSAMDVGSSNSELRLKW